MKKTILTIILTLNASAKVLCKSNGYIAYNNVTDLEYTKIPPLFHLDDYDNCMILKETSLYCNIRFQLSPIDPNIISEEWNIIQRIISLPRNYRRDQLRHGICIPKTCPNIPISSYSVRNGTKELWKSISNCYSDKYKLLGLKGKVIKLHCETYQSYYKIDNVDRAYGFIMIILISSIIIGTTYEIRARYRSPKEYDILTTQSQIGRTLTSLSISKNWDRLRSDAKSEDAKALSCLQAIRVINMAFVILCHTIIIHFTIPIKNPRYIEDTTLRPINMFVSNGGVICQTFFLLSGWMLSYNLLTLFKTKRISFKDIWVAIGFRYLRLAPFMLTIIGFYATWFRFLGRGQNWHVTVETEYENCRNNWIWNLLFLNNYINNSKMCVQQAWYIASDTQLYILGLLIMKMVMYNPKHANKIFSSFIILGILITFSEHYYKEYDIIVRSYAEIIEELSLNYDEWLDIYAKGHNQIPSYVQGLACGYYFYKFKQEKRTFKLNNFWAPIWLIIVWAMPIATILSAAFFYQEGFQYTRFQAALYQSLLRYSFEFPISVMLFSFAFGIGGPMLSFCNWKPFQSLGRLSLSVYLLHTLNIRIRIGLLRSLVYLSDFKLFNDFLGDLTFSLISGTIGCLLLEMPISALQKVVLSSVKIKEKVMFSPNKIK